MARHAAATGGDLAEAFRRTVAEFEGSVAIGAAAADAPDQVYLALRGSGQALYVGLADDLFIVASEPYGVVEETDAVTSASTARRRRPTRQPRPGVRARRRHGRRAGRRARLAYDGTRAARSTEAEVVTAQVTTRDIDRGDAPHFLLKEISEAPDELPQDAARQDRRDATACCAPRSASARCPPAIAARLAVGRHPQGPRHRPGHRGRRRAQHGGACSTRCATATLDVDPITATELSGFHLRLDMSDTLIVAVSQSGTTTDTNRTVDLARGRGAAVLAIVNRRNSDLTDKADGVMYTSDGRDVEMSVASTKAFYAQVAAGVLLACAIAEAAGRRHRRSAATSCSRRCATLPDAMREVIASRAAIAEAARRFAPSKRYWAIVGNGPNVVAAEEVRIKLSELCYKSIACDVTEDKKHIDLSSEPLILVCAAGSGRRHGRRRGQGGRDLQGPQGHADRHRHRGRRAVRRGVGGALRAGRRPGAGVRAVGDGRPPVRLRGGAGHRRLGPSAARGARGHRATRSSATSTATTCSRRVQAGDRRRTASASSTACAPAATTATSRRPPRCAWSACCATWPATRRSRRTSAAPARSPRRACSIDDLTAALTRAIEELTRPVDAIKHQAKTVTVGISRNDEGVLDRPLVQAVLAAGAGRDRLTLPHAEGARRPRPRRRVGRRLHPLPHRGRPGARRGDRSRSSTAAACRCDVPSRVERNSQLRRHQAARRQRARGARGPRPQATGAR